MIVLARLLSLLTGLLGAGGIATAAMAAHGGYGETLKTASEFALLHAALAVALLCAPQSRLSLASAGIVLVGTILFCGDLALRALAARGLFPMAAPLGGLALMGGWLMTGIFLFHKQKQTLR
jgi:uncharacterized membrane protein YgdD (TMEM256/DUF423 family)